VIEEADNGLSFLMRDLLQSLQSELSALDTRITEITGQLTRLSHELEACQRLQEMEGIGPQPFQGPIRKLLILNTFFFKNNLYYNL
jgi:hypothetical protein